MESSWKGLSRNTRTLAAFGGIIRLQAMGMQALIDADIDCTAAARLLMRMQADLLFIEKRERLQCHAAKRP